MNRLVMLLLLTIAFAACKKEDKTVTPLAPERPIPYLSKVVVFDTLRKVEQMRDSFSVDETGELQFIVAGRYNSNGIYHYTFNVITRDKKGNIVKVAADGIWYYPAYYTFEYDAKGNITKSTFVSNGSVYTEKDFTYDAQNRIATEQSSPAHESIGRSYYRTYTYKDGSTNPASVQETGSDAKTFREYLYTYDNKPNPYTTLPRILYYMDMGELATNNVISISVRDENNTITNIYRYDANNLPFDKQDNRGSQYKYYYTER